MGESRSQKVHTLLVHDESLVNKCKAKTEQRSPDLQRGAKESIAAAVYLKTLQNMNLRVLITQVQYRCGGIVTTEISRRKMQDIVDGVSGSSDIPSIRLRLRLQYEQ